MAFSEVHSPILEKQVTIKASQIDKSGNDIYNQTLIFIYKRKSKRRGKKVEKREK